MTVATRTDLAAAIVRRIRGKPDPHDPLIPVLATADKVRLLGWLRAAVRDELGPDSEDPRQMWTTLWVELRSGAYEPGEEPAELWAEAEELWDEIAGGTPTDP